MFKLPVFILLFAYCAASAGDFKYLNFSTADGLAGDNVYSIVQDNDGFIWIATKTGLSRFDGSYFRNFTVKDGLPANEVTSLFVDSRNRVWISPFKNELCYYYHGKIYNRWNDSLVKNIPISSETKSICEDAGGSILVESTSYFVLIDTNNKCTIYPRPYKRKGFFKPLRGSRYISKEIIAPAAKSFIKTGLHYIYNFYNPSDSSRYEYSEEEPVIQVLKNNAPYFSMPVPANVTSNYPFLDSLFIFNTTDGSLVYDIGAKRLIFSLLKGFYVNHTYLDKEAGIWLGTNGSGVFYLPPGKSLSIQHTSSNMPLQASNFYPSGKTVLVGTGNSQFWSIDRQNYSLGKQIYPGSITAKMLYPAKGNVLKYSDKGLLKILKDNKIPISEGKSIAVLDDTLTIATYSNTVQVVLPDPSPVIIWEGRSTCAYYLNGTYYIGSLDGLYVFKKDSLLHNASNTSRIINETIGSIAWNYQDDLICVTTSSNGIYFLKNNRIVKNINEANGLSSNICTSIFSDGNKVFVGTNNGLNVIHPENHFNVDHYYTLDGLVSDNINCVYATGGMAWVGTPAGISFIDVDKKNPLSLCRLTMTGISVVGRAIPPDTGYIKLAPQQNDLEFRYSGISYRSMGMIRYTYRLYGLKDQWQTTNQNYLKYPSLPSGKYRFEIFATNRYGVKSNTYILNIEIRQYWWEYTWVKLLALLLLSCLMFLLFRYRYRLIQSRMKEKAELKERITELEQLALQAQMNPHFIFNSLNSFYQYVIHKDLAGASKFMSDFSKLIRLLFEITARKELPLDKEIIFLTTYLELEKTKLNNSFRYRLFVQEDIFTEEIQIPTFIIQPFVENSIRHGVQNLKGKAGEINITIVHKDGAIVVEIADNGVGRVYTNNLKKTQVITQESNGTSLTMERIHLYNRSHHTDITIEIIDKYENDIATGTLVVIHFPLNEMI